MEKEVINIGKSVVFNHLAGEVADLNPRALVEDRKLHKLIRRTDLVGLYAAGEALKASGLTTWRETLDEAASAAEEDRQQDAENLLNHVYASSATVPKLGFVPEVPQGEKIVMVDAINHALAEELEFNHKMLVYGQDVGGDKGGVFTATRGLTSGTIALLARSSNRSSC